MKELFLIGEYLELGKLTRELDLQRVATYVYFSNLNTSVASLILGRFINMDVVLHSAVKNIRIFYYSLTMGKGLKVCKTFKNALRDLRLTVD